MTFQWRTYLLASIAYNGAILFGYDTGVAGSVIALKSFQNQFGLVHPGASQTPAEKKRTANLSANVVSVLQAGAFVGALAGAPLSDKFGRRIALGILAIIFMIGGIVQTVANGSLGAVYAGRVIAGVGVGGLSALAPTYVAECAPKRTRGRIAGLFQVFVATGVMFSYWITYGVNLHVKPTSSSQWRIPFAFQLIPAGLLIFGLFFTKESPRWLARKGRNDEALANLAYLRHTDPTDSTTLEEFAEIRASIDQETEATAGFSYKEALLPGNRIRFFIGFMIMTCQQWSGQNIVGYYAPTIFESIGIAKTNASLFASGIYGIVKTVCTAIYLIIGIEQVGRKWSLGLGGLWMGLWFFIIGAIGKTHPPNANSPHVTAASKMMAASLYIYVMGYCFSWGPVPWVYASEIFPNRLRALGVGWTAAVQWIMNFALSRTAPVAEINLGFNLFITFGAVNIFNSGFGFLLPETKGKSLEEMDVIFGFVSKEQREEAVHRVERDFHLGSSDVASGEIASSKSIDEKIESV